MKIDTIQDRIALLQDNIDNWQDKIVILHEKIYILQDKFSNHINLVSHSLLIYVKEKAEAVGISNYGNNRCFIMIFKLRLRNRYCISNILLCSRYVIICFIVDHHESEHEDKHCLYIKTEDRKFEWHIKGCDSHRQYICEKLATVQTVMSR